MQSVGEKKLVKRRWQGTNGSLSLSVKRQRKETEEKEINEENTEEKGEALSCSPRKKIEKNIRKKTNEFNSLVEFSETFLTKDQDQDKVSILSI